jgi:glyoxylase-like metal-dependent hydrolase (beta-lactamase superfamily II)
VTRHAAPDPQERRGLLYPHGSRRPGPGELIEVASGIHWLRMPLPFSLDHINLWVLDGGDHWVIVDTGVATPEIKAHWRALFAGPLSGKRVGRVIVTHYHPDHIGLAGWLARKWGVVPEITRAEFLLARVLTLDAGGHPPDEVVSFYARHGWPQDALAELRASAWGGFARGVHPLPQGYRRLREGDRLHVGTRSWEIVVGSGHSPEHACLWCPEEAILISGDQVLPRITSNVSVYPTEPDADPLGDWLDSIDRLRRVAAHALVLPAHNEPFIGLHARLDQLAADHMRKLEALRVAAAAAPLSAWDSFRTLFGRAIRDGERQMATGEALAHLHWLARRRELEAEEISGVVRFRASGTSAGISERCGTATP